MQKLKKKPNNPDHEQMFVIPLVDLIKQTNIKEKCMHNRIFTNMITYGSKSYK